MPLRARVAREANWHCEHCGNYCRGKGTYAIDHKVSRRLAPELTYERTNLQLLCTACHNKHKQIIEANWHKGSFVDEQGLPQSWSKFLLETTGGERQSGGGSSENDPEAQG